MEFLIIFALILFNGLFAMSEIAVVSSRRSKLQQRADGGDTRARAVLELIESPSRFLSTVQVGITLISILAGAYGGTTVAKGLEPLIGVLPWLAPYKTEIAFALVVLAITYLSLVVGELAPKRLAMRSPERIASLVALPVRYIAVFLAPLVWLLTHSTDALLKLFGRPGAHEPPVTEEEIRVLMHEGTRAGVFEEAEQDIVHSVLSLGDRQVDSLMTPRPDVVWLDLEDTIEETQRKITESPHARFPVAEGSLDTVKGVVRARDLVLLGGKLTKEALTALLQPPLYVPGNLSAFQLLEQFKKSRTHMALVIDEYGGLQGIVTLHDILEAILGDLPGAEAEEEPWVLKREDGSYLIDGALPIEEFKELFELNRLPEEEKYRTLGGLVLAELGRIPTAGESFTFEGLTIEVVDMDANRIDKVLVSKHKEPSRSNPPEEKPANG